MTRDIRRPTVGDAGAIGRVHVLAWQAAYRSVMPGEYLDALSAEDRASMWGRRIGAVGGKGLLVAVVDGVVVGFAAFGPSEDAGAAEAEGQLYAINFDPEYWGRGHGRALLRAATTELESDGFASLILWVVPQNVRARRLYESERWVADELAREEEVLGVSVREMRYRRPAVSKLAHVRP